MSPSDLLAVAPRSRYGLWSQRWPNAFGGRLCLRTVCLGAVVELFQLLGDIKKGNLQIQCTFPVFISYFSGIPKRHHMVIRDFRNVRLGKKQKISPKGNVDGLPLTKYVGCFPETGWYVPKKEIKQIDMNNRR